MARSVSATPVSPDGFDPDEDNGLVAGALAGRQVRHDWAIGNADAEPWTHRERCLHAHRAAHRRGAVRSGAAVDLVIAMSVARARAWVCA